MTSLNNLYGLVVCGGSSSRMGFDKGSIIYYEKQQRYHLYEMLTGICDKVFLSCSKSQSDNIAGEYETMIDLPEYENTGPMAALLTAFEKYPDNNFLAVGCDYPILSESELKNFLRTIECKKEAAAFFNTKENIYEPLLALYSSKSGKTLKRLFGEKNFSIQYYMKSVVAEKYLPENEKVIFSVDTPEALDLAKAMLDKTNKELDER